MSRPLTDFIDEWGFFVPVPEIVIERIAGIGVDAFGLFSYLRYRTHKDRHVAWPAYPRIMKDTGLSRNRLASAIRVLEGANLLMRTKRFGASTVYRLVPPPGVAGMSSPETGRLGEKKDASSPERGRQSCNSRTAVPHHEDATQDSITQDSEEVVAEGTTTTSEILSRVCGLGVDLLTAQRLILETPIETLEQYLGWAAIGQRCAQLTSPGGWFIAAVRGRWTAPRWIAERGPIETGGRRYVEGELKDFIEH